jgi:hypothetical protein
MLRATFDAGAGPNEAHLSLGDSGGGVFLWNGAAWALAGVNYTVDGPYNTNTVGNGFSAAIFDEYGLYTGGSGSWQVVNSHTPGAFYASRISARTDWINSVIPEPSSFALVGLGLVAALARCRATRRCRR